jgi:hypothetical protein
MGIEGPDDKVKKINLGQTTDLDTKKITPIENKTILKYNTSKKPISSKTPLRASKAIEGVFSLLHSISFLCDPNKHKTTVELILASKDYQKAQFDLDSELKSLQTELSDAKKLGMQDKFDSNEEYNEYIKFLEDAIEERNTVKSNVASANVSGIVESFLSEMNKVGDAKNKKMTEISTDFSSKEIQSIDDARKELFDFLNSSKNRVVDFSKVSEGSAKEYQQIKSLQLKRNSPIGAWIRGKEVQSQFWLLQFREELDHLGKNHDKIKELLLSNLDAAKGDIGLKKETERMLSNLNKIQDFCSRMHSSPEIQYLQAEHQNIVAVSFGSSASLLPKPPEAEKAASKQSKISKLFTKKEDGPKEAKVVYNSDLHESSAKYSQLMQEIGAAIGELRSAGTITLDAKNKIPSGITSHSQTLNTLISLLKDGELIKEDELLFKNKNVLKELRELFQEGSTLYKQAEQKNKVAEVESLETKILQASDIFLNQIVKNKLKVAPPAPASKLTRAAATRHLNPTALADVRSKHGSDERKGFIPQKKQDDENRRDNDDTPQRPRRGAGAPPRRKT